MNSMPAASEWRDPHPGGDLPSPNEEFPARVPIDITYSAVLLILITVNIYTVLKLKIYGNFNSLMIMFCLTAIEIIRMLTFIWRVVNN